MTVAGRPVAALDLPNQPPLEQTTKSRGRQRHDKWLIFAPGCSSSHYNEQTCERHVCMAPGYLGARLASAGDSLAHTCSANALTFAELRLCSGLTKWTGKGVVGQSGNRICSPLRRVLSVSAACFGALANLLEVSRHRVQVQALAGLASWLGMPNCGMPHCVMTKSPQSL